MLGSIPPAQRVSVALLQEAIPIMQPPPAGKETHEGAGAVLAAALPRHLGYVLRYGAKDAADAPKAAEVLKNLTALIAKEMGSIKPGVKKAFVALAGSVFFEDAVERQEGEVDRVTEFAKAVLPSFESLLKNATANPLNAVGIVEGYIAAAVLLGPVARLGKFGGFFFPSVLRAPRSVLYAH